MTSAIKLIGHNLGKCIEDLAGGHVAISSVIHIESVAIIPTTGQLRNFIELLPLGDQKHRAFDIALSLWDAGRLVHDPRAEKRGEKLGRWRTANTSEIGSNQPHEAPMASFASRIRSPEPAANDADELSKAA